MCNYFFEEIIDRFKEGFFLQGGASENTLESCAALISGLFFKKEFPYTLACINHTHCATLYA